MEQAEVKVVFKGELSNEAVEKRSVYLQTIYKESRDSFKQLIVLISSIIVAYASLSETEDKTEKVSIIALLALTLVCSVIGMYILKMAGEKATNLNIWTFRSRVFTESSFETAAIFADWFLEGTIVLLVISLFFLGFTLAT